MSLLAAFTWAQLLLGVGLILVCGLLILVVLVQQASGGGLVGAFGGGGGGGAFGAKTGDVFTVITCSLAGLYLFLAVIGNYVFVPPTVASPAVVEVPDAPFSTPTATLPANPGASPVTTTVTPPASSGGPAAQPAGVTPADPAKPADTGTAEGDGETPPPASGDER